MAGKCSNGTWTANITIQGRAYHIGTFDTKTEAQDAEKVARVELGPLQKKRGRSGRSDWRANIAKIKVKLS